MTRRNIFDGMDAKLKTQVEGMSTAQRRYAEYRARGFNQPDSAERAGSEAKTRESLSRVGYNWEVTVDGLKEYIMYLQLKRAQWYGVEESEVVEKLRETYDSAIDAGKFGDAIKAAELLGQYIGMFGKAGAGASKSGNPNEKERVGAIENDVNAFKDDGEAVGERVKKFAHLLKDMYKA